jgi:hypothetical protein
MAFFYSSSRKFFETTLFKFKKSSSLVKADQIKWPNKKRRGSLLKLAKWKKKYCNLTILTGSVSNSVEVDTAAAADFHPQQSQDKKRPT